MGDPVDVGVDVGATLSKLAVRDAHGGFRFLLLPSQAIERAAREVEALAPQRIALTGAGSPQLAELLGLDTTPVNEFEAWGAGVELLLARQGEPRPERDLLVSLGTGTSVLLVEPDRVLRVGGTALGGGTLRGLGAALLGTDDFEQIAALAASGDRRRVDLLVGEIDAAGLIPLPRELTASALAKLATAERSSIERRDLAHALVGMLADNVAVLCAALAAATGARRIVYAGSSLRENPALRAILSGAAFGRPVLLLRDGEFVGAIGALALAS